MQMNKRPTIKKKAASLVSKNELKKIYKELKEQEMLEQEMKINIVKKATFSVQRLLYKNSYFGRLFPSIKE